MPNDDITVEPEYEAGQSTEVPRLDDQDEDPDLKVEVEQYGVGKPRRLIIRAQIIHDQSQD